MSNEKKTRSEKLKETNKKKRIKKLNNKLNETNSEFLYITNKSSGEEQLSIDYLEGQRKSTIHFNCGFCGNHDFDYPCRENYMFSPPTATLFLIKMR